MIKDNKKKDKKSHLNKVIQFGKVSYNCVSPTALKEKILTWMPEHEFKVSQQLRFTSLIVFLLTGTMKTRMQ